MELILFLIMVGVVFFISSFISRSLNVNSRFGFRIVSGIVIIILAALFGLLSD